MNSAIGIIGGSGLYEMEGLEDVHEVEVSTPFGAPSDSLVAGIYRGRRLVFLPRHGRGHRYLPAEVPYRANVYALKSLGVEWVISISAVGSLDEELRPGDICLPDQFIDRTWGRPGTFFGNGIAGHVALADPICNLLQQAVWETVEAVGARFHRGGAYLCIQGPQFSTRAESFLYRSWGARVIGMTNATEARLAREAELCYTTVALVTDYDCWHETEEEVSIEAVLAVMQQNVGTARRILQEAVARVPAERTCPCREAARYAIMTPPELVPPDTRRSVDLLFGKYLRENTP
ncbi:MAG: S-methyl-5'-thioadenosine phosphorylase [Deltaproteobacteria bacterium]|nr:S-methyl-5'-thioadenosine phosphorylase [Deltaproteobacteria bacterium]